MNMTEKRYTIRRIKEIAKEKMVIITRDFECLQYKRKEDQPLSTKEIAEGIETGELIFQDISDILDMVKNRNSPTISKEKLFTEDSVNKLHKKLFKKWTAQEEEKKKKLAEITEDFVVMQDEIMLEGGTLLMSLTEFKSKRY